MKFVSESFIFNNMWKACGTPKELKGPTEGRGPPVEKHCYKGCYKKLQIASRRNFLLCQIISVYLITIRLTYQNKFGSAT